MTQHTHCPNCFHPPLRHIPDGNGATCLVCLWELQEQVKRASEGLEINQVCKGICSRKFEFKIQGREREQAMLAYKESWPMHTVCIQCGCEWMQHFGYLCPTGDDLFMPLIETDPGKDVVGKD